MSWLHRFMNLGRSSRVERDIDRELSFHIAERVDELMAGGMSEREARAVARRQFGNRTYQAERTRDVDVVGWLDSVLADVRYGLRALRRSPVFTAVVVASLALGIGANTAIYSLIDAVMLRSLPVPRPEELLRVTAGDDDVAGWFSNPLWEQVRDRQTGFARIAAFSETAFNVADGGEVRYIRGLRVSGDYFALFGTQPRAGRLFSRADDVRGCAALAVLDHAFWRSEYGGADIAGKTLSLDGKTFHVVGVAAPGFAGPEVGRHPHVYVPLCADAHLRGSAAALDQRSRWWMRVIGRRDPQLSVPQVVARLKAIAPDAYASTIPQHWAEERKGEYRKRTFNVVPASNGISGVRDRYSAALKLLMGAVALVLLIACANVANLLLARSAARQREVAIRLAVGAARRRLIRQLLTESTLLAMIGGVVGLVAGLWGTRALVALISTPNDQVSLDLALNGRVLGFTALLAMATATLFGLVPAWRGTRISPQAAMKANSRGVAGGQSPGGARFTLGKALVVVQVALSLTLLVGAGLLIGSLRNLVTTDPGFRSEGVLIAGTGFERTGFARHELSSLQREVLERVRALPGVRAASTASQIPISTNSWNEVLVVDGFTPKSELDALAWFNAVSGGYFATLDITLLAGRDFEHRDAGTRVAIVNQQAARKFFGDASPLGRQYRTVQGATLSDPITIVGVVEDAKYQTLRETESPSVYVPADEFSQHVTMLVRAGGDPLALVPGVKAVVAQMHPLASMEFSTLSGQLSTSLQREWTLALLSGLFGAVALALSMLGLYGVMAYTVARRRNEFGVRIALGADRGRVLRMVLGDVSRVVLVGLVIGTAGAIVAGKLVRAFLFALEPSDPVVLGSAIGLLAAVALGAGLVPALRAARADPVAALRED